MGGTAETRADLNEDRSVGSQCGSCESEGNAHTVTSGVCRVNCRGSMNGAAKSRPMDTGRTR